MTSVLCISAMCIFDVAFQTGDVSARSIRQSGTFTFFCGHDGQGDLPSKSAIDGMKLDRAVQ